MEEFYYSAYTFKSAPEISICNLLILSLLANKNKALCTTQISFKLFIFSVIFFLYKQQWNYNIYIKFAKFKTLINK